MKTKLEMAQENLIALISVSNGVIDIDEMTELAWKLVDAMKKQDDKRKKTGLPCALIQPNYRGSLTD